METIEINEQSMELLQSLNDNDLLLGYSASGKKVGLVRVGKINSTTYAGCRWDKNSMTTVGEPIGSITKIENLAKVFGLGGYLVQNDHSRRKLSVENHNTFEDGSVAALDGTMGHYQWGSGVDIYYAHWTDGDYECEAIDTKPITGRKNIRIPVFSRSCAGFATVDRTDLRLVSYISNDVRYRGGNNDATLDAAYNSQLGKPATNMPIQTFAQYARKNGKLWFANARVINFITAAIFRIYFHNRNIQAALNTTLTAEGLHQGGCGAGADQPANWNANFKYYPYIPLSAGVELGDATTKFSVTIQENGASKTINNIPSTLGLKNWYKYLWGPEEDSMLKCMPDKSQQLLIKNEINGDLFDFTTDSDKIAIGRTPPYESAAWKFTKKMCLDNAAMVPAEVGATETTGWADGYYSPAATSGFRGSFRLGRAGNGGSAGSGCLTGSVGVSAAYACYGAFLGEFKSAFSTEETLYN